MEPGMTHCSAFLDDSIFGTLHIAHNYRWTGSYIANPEYNPKDMRTAVLHALASSTDTTTLLLTITVLPVWEDTPWQSAAIRSHTNMETLIHIPTGHMRFVPTHNQYEGEHKWRSEHKMTRGSIRQRQKHEPTERRN